MKYQPREEVVDHAVSQKVTLQLCTRCGRRPDGLDETRGPYQTTLGKWDAPFIALSMREFEGRGEDAHKKGLEPQPDPVLYVSPKEWRALVANAGNAKARRRWRRRNLPNTQRPTEGQEQWARTRLRGEWQLPIHFNTGGSQIGLKGEVLP